DAVDGRDHRLAAAPNVQDHVTGHGGELVEAGAVAAKQRADDVLHVSAGAEAAAGPCDHDRAHLAHFRQPGEGAAQLGVDLEGERVQSIGAIQGDRGDAGIAWYVAKRARLDARVLRHGTTAVASISTIAPLSTRPLTSTSATAG